MQLQPSDHITDETAEWEVIGRPFTNRGGKECDARVRKASQPHVTDLRTWGAREQVSVKPASAEEGKR
jgi:hypothetical protein